MQAITDRHQELTAAAQKVDVAPAVEVQQVQPAPAIQLAADQTIAIASPVQNATMIKRHKLELFSERASELVFFADTLTEKGLTGGAKQLYPAFRTP